MDIEYALIADFAEIANGKLYLMGGGWDSFYLAETPAVIRMAIAVGVRFGWEETNRPAPILITIEDDDGKQLVKIDGTMNVGRPPHLAPGSAQLAQMAANVAYNVEAFGGYRVLIRVGEAGEATQTIPFRATRRG